MREIPREDRRGPKLLPKPSRGPVSLERRLFSVGLGLINDSRVLDARLKRMDSYPLEDWFGTHPERLEQLRAAFHGMEECATFGQAAALLWQYHPQQLGIDGMWLLLSPLLDIDQHMIKLTEGGAAFWAARSHQSP